MRLASLSSGSSGNSIYVGSDTTHILVDTGCSKKRIEEGLSKLDLSLADIDAIFVTHEHSDHINGLHTILKKYEIPVYATKGTIEGIRISDKKREMDNAEFHEIKADKKLSVKDLTINPMTIMHDALEPVGYRISCGKSKMAIATDLGCYNEYTVDCLQGLDAVLIEANHDVRMLQTGPYPYVLKARILGDKGHLCNEKSGELLSKLINNKLQGVFLGHLSKENNLPELAYEAVRVELQMNDSLKFNDGFPIMVADRSSISTVLEF